MEPAEDAADYAGYTALHLAAIQENKELCELLIDKGARVNNKNKIGFTPLDSTLYFNEVPYPIGKPFTEKIAEPDCE